MRLVHIVESGERAQMSKRSGDFVSPRRAARRHRRRRDALVHALAQPRHHGRPRPRAGAPPVQRQPRLLRAVRARPHRQHPAQSRRRAERWQPAPAPRPRAPRWSRPSASWSSACSSSPSEVREAAARRAPHRICAYSTAVAADFHAFYRDCQVVGAEGEGVERSRLALCPAHQADDRRRARPARHLRPRADVMLRPAQQAAGPGGDPAAPSDSPRPGALRPRRPGGVRRAWRASWPARGSVLVTGAGAGGRRRSAWRPRRRPRAAASPCSSATWPAPVWPATLGLSPRLPACTSTCAARRRRPRSSSRWSSPARRSAGATEPLVCIVAGEPEPRRRWRCSTPSASATRSSACAAPTTCSSSTVRRWSEDADSLRALAEHADATVACGERARRACRQATAGLRLPARSCRVVPERG